MDAFKIKKGLGRGLSSLIGDTKTNDKVNKVLIGDLVRNKYQPRKNFNKENLEELSNSIKERGIIQPIVVRPLENDKSKFEIIAGERRWIAAQNAGLNEVPVTVLNIDNLKSLEFAIVENVQRSNLNPIEEANGYQRLVDEFSYDQEKISRFIGKSRSHIANCLRLLNLPTEVKSYLENDKLTLGHAKILVGLPNAQFLAKKIVDKKLSVRQAENLVRVFKSKSNLKIVSNQNADIYSLEKSLEEKTGLNVKIINSKKNSGKIYFEYKDLEQLDKIIDIIKKNF
ncbi:MAG: ParB/RepB/Spo0J family partition protein [Candidatus Pelagibacterales bacterium]|nr:MAG: ParB/RepB/Spo0J family partition protein [Pelagibacterales bacterium]|tara:strand:- start:8383 stop:9234 length:852 start_codon:yes stop_codon:yes gene_type:complete